MMATCIEIVLFLPNICFLKNDGRKVSNQSPIGRQSPSELVVDQSPMIVDLSPNCKTITERAATDR